MALVDTTWYVNSVAYTAVTQFAISTAYTAGQIRRQLATPAVGSERVFICIVAGTSAGSEPSWTLTRGAKTVSNTATFQEVTGQAALNGDLTNTATWAQVKAATPAVLGQIIKRSSGASYQICTTAGAMSASEPAFSDTAGVTTTDTTAVWTSLGAVGSYTGGMAPHARIASALASTWFALGNTMYVGSNHAETQASSISISALTGVGSINKIICHNSAGSYPPTGSDIRTTATVTTTGGNSVAISASGTGNFYIYGITFSAGTGTGSGLIVNTNSGCWFYLDNCVLKIPGTTSGNTIAVGSGNAGFITFNNVQVSFGAVGNLMSFDSSLTFIWQNTGTILASGSLVPATLMNVGWPGRKHEIVLEALDLSQLTGNLVNFTGGGTMSTLMLRDCKLNASMTVQTPDASTKMTQLSRSSS